MSDVLSMLLGAGLVSVGVLATATADRIRGLRMSKPGARDLREIAPPEMRTKRTASGTPGLGIVTMPAPAPVAAPMASADMDDVIAALIGSGIKKPLATKAATACSASERASLQTWIVAALRRANGGAA